MSRLAFLFPGQGSQKVGMGSAVRDTHPDIFERYLGLADAAAGRPIQRLVLEGPQDELTRTEIAQPALFAVSLAVHELARERDLDPDFVAGHSLGEYTAAVAAGALGLEAGMDLVAQRGRLMADIQGERPGSMAAIIGLELERVEELCHRAAAGAVLEPANINAREQVVVSGEVAAIDRIVELAPAAGAKQVHRLEVGAAFHSRMMEPVQRALDEITRELAWQDPRVPLVSNASGQLVSSGVGVREALVAQIASPVQWLSCVETLAAEGCERFLELGPGRVLSRLVRRIEPAVQTLAADSSTKLDEWAGR